MVDGVSINWIVIFWDNAAPPSSVHSVINWIASSTSIIVSLTKKNSATAYVYMCIMVRYMIDRVMGADTQIDSWVNGSWSIVLHVCMLCIVILWLTIITDQVDSHSIIAEQYILISSIQIQRNCFIRFFYHIFSDLNCSTRNEYITGQGYMHALYCKIISFWKKKNEFY